MIPDFQTIMLPLLVILGDKKEHDTQNLMKTICDKYKLTEEERGELLPSGSQRIINNRVAWARIYLQKAKLIESPKRSTFKITEDGLKILASPPKRIDIKYLKGNQLDDISYSWTCKTLLPIYSNIYCPYVIKSSDNNDVLIEDIIYAQLLGRIPGIIILINGMRTLNN